MRLALLQVPQCLKPMEVWCPCRWRLWPQLHPRRQLRQRQHLQGRLCSWCSSRIQGRMSALPRKTRRRILSRFWSPQRLLSKLARQYKPAVQLRQRLRQHLQGRQSSW